MAAHFRMLAAAALCFAAGLAQAIEYSQVQPARSQVSFVSKQMGVPVDGRFRRFSAQMAFDPAKPEAGRAQIEIDMASVDTGSDEANEEVVSRNWFNVKAYPKAQFVSTSVKPLGNGRYEVAGRMTIKGRTRDVSAPFVLKQEGGAMLVDGGFTLKRLEWGIGEGPWSDLETVADDVQVKFKFSVAPAAAARN